MSFVISTPSQFEGLTANSRYEVIVQSKNRFGWSEPAKSFVFSTRLKGKNFKAPYQAWKLRSSALCWPNEQKFGTLLTWPKVISTQVISKKHQPKFNFQTLVNTHYSWGAWTTHSHVETGTNTFFKMNSKFKIIVLQKKKSKKVK